MEHQGAILNKPSPDLRKYPRKRCYLPILEPERDTEPFGSILNLSTSGVFVETDRIKDQRERFKAHIFIPGVSDPIDFCGEVVRLQSGGQRTSLTGIGLQFIEINGEHQKTLRNYLLNHGFNENLKNFQRQTTSPIENLKPFNDPEIIHKIFVSAAEQKAHAHIFWLRRYTSIATFLKNIDKDRVTLEVPEHHRLPHVRRYDPLYLNLIYQGISYFFESAVEKIGQGSLAITCPDVIYFEERRVETRYSTLSTLECEGISIEFSDAKSSHGRAGYKVIDHNSSGLSFKLSSTPTIPEWLSPGGILREIKIINGNKIQQQDKGKLVHITQVDHQQFKVGLEFFVERQPYEFKQIEFHEPPKRGSFISPLIRTARNVLAKTEVVLPRLLNRQPQVHVVKYCNKKGEEIVAILNATFNLRKNIKGKITAPVVIIPPAFARRKETTSLLALTIVENFRKLGKEVVVVRYDGIRSVGESHNDQECRHDGKEMLNFRTSQGIDDLLTTVDFISGYDSPVSVSEAIIVSFSNASVGARKALLGNRGHKITYWVSAMGITDPQDLIMNATCGIDYVSNYEMGDREGSFELLGHLVKKESLGDVIDHQMARLEDARKDMAVLEIPITWVYGKHDYWTNEKRVKDVMSVKSAGRRSVIEVPTGHIVRTGTEAMCVFALIAEMIWQHLHGSSIEAIVPRRVKALLTYNAEWARVKRHAIEHKKYWKEYLIGKQLNSLGFDVLSLTKEYQEMMERQVDLLDLKDGELIGDMGGGTGNLSQCIFQRFVILRNQDSGERQLPRVKIIQVDLVPEILQKSKTKHEKLKETDGLPVELEYKEADLNVKHNEDALPFPESHFSKIIGSLLISYLENPARVLDEFYRILKPGGAVILSSLRRDADMSKAFHALVERIRQGEVVVNGFTKEEVLSSVQEYINATAHLSDLEEEGVFRFYTDDEIKELLKRACFKEVQIYRTGGTPPQILVGIGYK
jgi:ubiquinone/menaquinone biosynthesis C-methylase UbiE